MTDNDVCSMNMFGELNPPPDYSELPQPKPNDPPEDRYSRPVGGKMGWDDFVERWHE